MPSQQHHNQQQHQQQQQQNNQHQQQLQNNQHQQQLNNQHQHNQQQQQQPSNQTQHEARQSKMSRKKKSRKSKKQAGSNLTTKVNGSVTSQQRPPVSPPVAPNTVGGAATATVTTTTTSTTAPNIDESTESATTTSDYKLLLTPMFSAMTKITDHLFLTGVGGMTRENFRKNHIDFVVNITTEAPFWEDIESMRLPLEDDPSTNILPYLDMAVDRINESIVKRNSHVLVHCLAGVSRSATIVIAYLMKHRRMDLKSAFNFCYNLRPVIRPNNGFMHQLMNYELQLFGRSSVWMVDVDVEGVLISVPHFFVEEHPRLVVLEVLRVKEQHKVEAAAAAAAAAGAASSAAAPTPANANQNNPHAHNPSTPFNLTVNKTVANNDN